MNDYDSEKIIDLMA
ncbi:MAG: hypothetical protein MRZ56_06460, partial [Sutterella sp.]|nr:hypothetical protein [Sutterella sp.]